MANDTPLPQAAVSVVMANMLMVLYKCPEVWLVGIGEIWRRLFAKCVLKVAGTEDKKVCGSHQLCTGFEAGIEGVVHAVRAMWNGTEDNEEWEFLLVDAANVFNSGNRTAILWTVRYL